MNPIYTATAGSADAEPTTEPAGGSPGVSVQKGVVFFVTGESAAAESVTHSMARVAAPATVGGFHAEMDLHRQPPTRLADKAEQISGRVHES